MTTHTQQGKYTTKTAMSRPSAVYPIGKSPLERLLAELLLITESLPNEDSPDLAHPSAAILSMTSKTLLETLGSTYISQIPPDDPELFNVTREEFLRLLTKDSTRWHECLLMREHKCQMIHSYKGLFKTCLFMNGLSTSIGSKTNLTDLARTILDCTGTHFDSRDCIDIAKANYSSRVGIVDRISPGIESLVHVIPFLFIDYFRNCARWERLHIESAMVDVFREVPGWQLQIMFYSPLHDDVWPEIFGTASTRYFLQWWPRWGTNGLVVRTTHAFRKVNGATFKEGICAKEDLFMVCPHISSTGERLPPIHLRTPSGRRAEPTLAEGN